jgi:iron-sulfur cluster insertion protein|tara:strand:- start:484 stop:804 length:321 start_codon:yes stop_codon:yes gene_type:complete
MTLTDNAVNKIKDLIAEENNPNINLRVYVQGGGCSGMQYGFTFDEEINEDDTKVEKDDCLILVDPMSLQYLQEAEIDYTESLQASQFSIKNPSAKASCGCGSSFAV